MFWLIDSFSIRRSTQCDDDMAIPSKFKRPSSWFDFDISRSFCVNAFHQHFLCGVTGVLVGIMGSQESHSILRGIERRGWKSEFGLRYYVHRDAEDTEKCHGRHTMSHWMEWHSLAVSKLLVISTAKATTTMTHIDSRSLGRGMGSGWNIFGILRVHWMDWIYDGDIEGWSIWGFKNWFSICCMCLYGVLLCIWRMSRWGN